MSGARQKGKVKWFRPEKGFGFIEVTDGKDVFFHQSVAEKEKLQPGDVVEFNLMKNKKGAFAVKIKKVS